MYHKRLVTHSFMEQLFLSSEIALQWRSFPGVTGKINESLLVTHLLIEQPFVFLNVALC